MGYLIGSSVWIAIAIYLVAVLFALGQEGGWIFIAGLTALYALAAMLRYAAQRTLVRFIRTQVRNLTEGAQRVVYFASLAVFGLVVAAMYFRII